MLQGFKNFIMRGNVVDLAVGVVIGVAFQNVVNAMVNGIITPLIGLLGGTPNFSNLTFTINRTKFLVGNFISALLSFLIIALVVYSLVVLPMNKLTQELQGPSKKPEERTCPECLSKIPAKAKKCKYCTSVVGE